MKKAFLFFVSGGVLGTVAGAGGMLIAFPFIFPPPQVNEKADAGFPLIGESRFRDDDSGQDAGHWGRGAIKFYFDKGGLEEGGAVVVEFQDDFEVGPGPNFWIYLNEHPGVEDEEEFLADATRAKLYKLKSFSGSQVYRLHGSDYAKSGALTIWCESFNQFIASADLPDFPDYPDERIDG